MLAVVKKPRTSITLSGPGARSVLHELQKRFDVQVLVAGDTIPLRKTGYFRSRKKDRTAHLLRGARYKAGLTQKELAEKTGISQGRVSEYETGRRTIEKVSTARKLARALKTDYRYFI